MAIRDGKRRNPDWKRRSKTVTVCRWHDTIYKNPKDATRKLLELISEFSEVSGYRINIQKSLAFVYTKNKKIRKRNETISFTTVLKRGKYPGINLHKEAKDLYSEKHKTLMKEVEVILTVGKIHHVLRLGE